MKTRSMLKLIIIFLCVLGFHLASAQSDYLVLTKGDTLYGKVKYLNFGMDQKVQINLENKKRTVYPMLEVKAFRIDNESYRLIRMYDRYRYMKPLHDGYLSLYAFQIDNQMNWDGRYLVKKDGTSVEVPNIGFKKKLSEFLRECPEVSEEITSGDAGRNELSEIIDKFNACISRNSETRIVREKTVEQALPVKTTEEFATWQTLEDEVKASENLENKETVLEMISEIKSKLTRNERIPNFLVDALKKSLEQHAHLQETLTKALNEIKEKN